MLLFKFIGDFTISPMMKKKACSKLQSSKYEMTPAKTTAKKHTHIGTKMYTNAMKNTNDNSGNLFFSCSSFISSQVKAFVSLFLVSFPFFCALSLAPPSAPPSAPPWREARRAITVGRDGRNVNFVFAIVPSAQRWMVERFGKFERVADPGLNLVIPLVERVAYKRSMKETTIPKP